jgi:hypothetical protein
MKKLVVLILAAAFISACSQYTCPTYQLVKGENKSGGAKTHETARRI